MDPARQNPHTLPSGFRVDSAWIPRGLKRDRRGVQGLPGPGYRVTHGPGGGRPCATGPPGCRVQDGRSPGPRGRTGPIPGRLPGRSGSPPPQTPTALRGPAGVALVMPWSWTLPTVQDCRRCPRSPRPEPPRFQHGGMVSRRKRCGGSLAKMISNQTEHNRLVKKMGGKNRASNLPGPTSTEPCAGRPVGRQTAPQGHAGPFPGLPGPEGLKRYQKRYQKRYRIRVIPPIPPIPPAWTGSALLLPTSRVAPADGPTGPCRAVPCYQLQPNQGAGPTRPCPGFHSADYQTAMQARIPTWKPGPLRAAWLGFNPACAARLQTESDIARANIPTESGQSSSAVC